MLPKIKFPIISLINMRDTVALLFTIQRGAVGAVVGRPSVGGLVAVAGY